MDRCTTFAVMAISAVMSCSTNSKPIKDKQDTARACRDDVAALQPWVDRLVYEGIPDPLAWQFGHILVELGDHESFVEPPVSHPVATVTVNDIALHSSFMALTEDVQNRLPAALDPFRRRAQSVLREAHRHCDVYPCDEAAILLGIEQSIPWVVVRQVVAAVHDSGYDRVVFMFAKESRVPEPKPNLLLDAIIDRYDVWRGSNPDTMSELGRLETPGLIEMDEPRPPAGDMPQHPVDAVLGACPSAMALVSQSTDGMTADAYRRIPDAVRACDCAARPESVKTLMWWWAKRRHGPDWVNMGLPVMLAADGAQRTPIAVADDTPWSEAYRAVATTVTAARTAPVVLLDRKTPVTPELLRSRPASTGGR